MMTSTTKIKYLRQYGGYLIFAVLDIHEAVRINSGLLFLCHKKLLRDVPITQMRLAMMQSDVMVFFKTVS